MKEGENVDNITIDSEFQSLIPPLTDDEYQRLEKSILSEGVRESIITWNGVIIDGHNRYRICEKHGLNFKTTEREFESRDAAKMFIIKNQLARRNLPVAAIGLLKLKEKEIVARQAEERLHLSQGRGKKGTPNLGEVLNKHDGETFQQLAKDIPLGRESLRKLDVIDQKAKEGNPVAIKEREQLMSGEKKSIHGSYIRVTGRDKPSPRKQNETTTTDGRRICVMCGEPINNGEAHTSRPTVHKKCEQEYQRDWEKEKRLKAKFTEDGRRICSICGEPINHGECYDYEPTYHKKCRTNQKTIAQRKYRDAEQSLRENVAVYSIESLIMELSSSAETLRESWQSSIETNEIMGVKLTKANKVRLEKAVSNLFTALEKLERKSNND